MRRAHPLLIAALALALAGLAVADGAAQETAREAVGRPVQAAQLLLRQHRAKDALAKLHDADAVKDKTPYETYVIEETRAAAQIDATDDAEAIKTLDRVLATDILAPAERRQRLQTQVQLADRLHDHAAVIERAARYYRQGGFDPLPRRLAAQAAYLDGDYAAAAKTIRIALDADKTGGTPPEDLLQTLASSEFKRGDADGYRDALTRLAASYPKPAYWADLLQAVRRAPSFSARLALDLERLRLATGAMAAPDQYVEAAELALSAGLPGDAKIFLDRGYQAGVLGAGPQAARQRRLAEMAARQAAEAALALTPRAAEAGHDGLAWETLGEAYASYGRHDDAIAAFDTSLRQGNLANPDDAKLRLGVACLAAGQAAKARTVLASITSGDGAAELARLWLLHGEQG